MHYPTRKQTIARRFFLPMLPIICSVFLSHAKTEVPVFLLSGQSNMTGYASASDLSADQKKNIDNVKIYMDLVWEGDAAKKKKWLTLGTGFGSNGNNIGPELYMGRTLSEAMPGKKIALVKYCSGSTYLGKATDWLPPSSNNGNGGTLYKNMMNVIDLTMKSFTTAFDTAQYTPRWAGFVWLQGEFDAGDLTLSNAYEKNLTNLIKDIRAKLEIPDLPVIIPMIDPQNQWRYHTIVREANVAVTQKMVNVDTLDTKGFPTDGTHYKGQGQVKVGTVTAERWLAMNYNYGSAVSTTATPHTFKAVQLVQHRGGTGGLTRFYDLSGRSIITHESISEPPTQQGVYILESYQNDRRQLRKTVSSGR